MAQYKAQMARYWGLDKAASPTTEAVAEDVEGPAGGGTGAPSAPPAPGWALVLRDNADYLLRTVLPVVWCCLLVIVMDRETFLRDLFMPFLGVGAALLANTVPIGGGIVYVPMLQLLGEKIQLSVSFTLATMTFGNGVFGFLHWLKTDASLIVWPSFAYTVLPSWAGSVIGILVLPPVETYWIRKLFGVFSVVLGAYVALLAYKAATSEAPSPALSSGSDSAPAAAAALTDSQDFEHKWRVVAAISFFGGLILVTNIGIGPALITFILLGADYMGYSHKQAIVTGIITGGWVCALPALLHFIVLRDVPLALWVMVLPGVYFGAHLAPRFFELVGLKNVLAGFCVFLFASSLLFLF